jgi:competence protein ComEA
MPRTWCAQHTAHAGPTTWQPGNPGHESTYDKDTVMKSIKLMTHSLLLALALAGSAFAAEKVNINTADAATIDRVLLNVGPAKAEAIVAYRKQNGAFKSPEQLAQVKGIGLKTVEKNRDRIAVGGAPASRTPATRAPAKKVAGR